MMGPVKAVIVGFGDVGKAVYDVFALKVDLLMYDQDLCEGPPFPHQEIDILMICIPYSEEFVGIVKAYQTFYKPKDFTIVFSTTQIGTCRQLENTVHVPIEGRHPGLGSYLRKMKFIVGFNQVSDARKLGELFELCGLSVEHFVEKTDNTEAMKLLSTLNYGVNIEFARMVNGLCKKHNLDYSVWKKYSQMYNKLYEGTPNIQRYILEPPEGNIGGHCVGSNANILDEIYTSIFTKIVMEGGLFNECGINSDEEGINKDKG